MVADSQNGLRVHRLLLESWEEIMDKKLLATRIPINHNKLLRNHHVLVLSIIIEESARKS